MKLFFMIDNYNEVVNSLSPTLILSWSELIILKYGEFVEKKIPKMKINCKWLIFNELWLSETI
jgi:hypothetical protein